MNNKNLSSMAPNIYLSSICLFPCIFCLIYFIPLHTHTQCIYICVCVCVCVFEYPARVKSGRFLIKHLMSSHTDELWYKKTVCLWMTIYIYLVRRKTWKAEVKRFSFKDIISSEMFCFSPYEHFYTQPKGFWNTEKKNSNCYANT